MIKTKGILALVGVTCLLITTFWAGKTFADREWHARMQGQLDPENVEMLNAAFENMSAEEIREVVDNIRNFSRTAVQELNQMTLFEAMLARRFLNARANGSDSNAWTLAEEKIEAFRRAYEEDSFDAGNWTKNADTLYQATGSQ